MDMDRMQSLMENFRGNNFQWIKTNDPQLRGKVVKCRDIKPQSNGRFIAMFDDGSQIDSAQLTSNMLMISGDTQPMSMSEINSIAGPTRQAPVLRGPEDGPSLGEGPITIPDHLKEHVTQPGQVQQTNHNNRIHPHQNSRPAPNMFGMFNSDETELNIKVKVKVPDRKLLKMMYDNAEDKEAFLTQLSEYLLSVINKQVVTDSMKSMLEPRTKSSVATMNITEINGKTK